MKGRENSAGNRLHRFVKIIKVLVGVTVILIGMPIAFLGYLTWSAEREAKAFCDAIEVGSDISLAILRMDALTGYVNKEGGKVSARHYGYPDAGYAKESHTFMFPSFMFDRAYCIASLAKNGKVESKYSYFQAD